MHAHTLAWLLLAGSIVAEVLGTVALRYAGGFTRALPSIAVAACYGGAVWLMSLAIRHLEVGLTYAVWAGCGTALTAAVGVIWFHEPLSLLKMIGLGSIVFGVVALNLTGR